MNLMNRIFWFLHGHLKFKKYLGSFLCPINPFVEGVKVQNTASAEIIESDSIAENESSKFVLL